MSETFEGIFVFEDEEHMKKGVELLEAKGILSDVFRYAINYDQKLVVLPRAEYQGLSEIKNDLFEWVDPMHSHLDGIVITDDILLISWDIHTQSFFELEGMEIAAMFDEQSEKDFFELSPDSVETMSEQAFIEKRDALGMQAYYRLPGYIESVRVDSFLQEKLS